MKAPTDLYLIEWSPDGSEWFIIDEVDGSDTSYSDEYPVLGESYYAVRGVDEVYDGEGTLIDSAESDASSSLAVTPIAPPVAWADNNGGVNDRGTLSPFATPHDQPIVLDVLANDIDYDNSGTLTLHAITTAPAHGTVTLNPDQTLTYTPDPAFVGTDTFEYTITDGQAVSAPAEVAIDVTNTAPVAESRIAYFDGDDFTRASSAGTGDGHYDQLHRTAGDAQALHATDDDGDTITYEVVTVPEHGEVTIDAATGSYIYTPHATFHGLDRFTYVANDGLSQSAPAGVTVNGFQAPDSYSPEGGVWAQAWSVPYSLRVVALTDGSRLADRILPLWDLSQVNSSLSIEFLDPPSQGTITQDASVGKLIYTPYASFSGSDDLTFVIHNGAMTSAPVNVRYDFVQSNSAATDQYYTSTILNGGHELIPLNEATVHPEDATLLGDASFTATGWHGEPGWTFTIVNQPQHGTITLDPSGEQLTFTPAFDPAAGGAPFLGEDSFSFVGTLQGVAHPTQWVQLNVTYDSTPPSPPMIVRQRSSWTYQPFHGKLADLQQKVQDVTQKRLDVISAYANLGIAWERVNDEAGLPGHDIEHNATQVSDELDALHSAYLTYLDGRAELESNAADYQASWTGSIQWFDKPQLVEEVMNSVLDLVPTVGGLTPGLPYWTRLQADTLRLGDALVIQSKFLDTAYETTEQAHQVVTVAEYSLGLLSGGTYTMATLTSKAGLRAMMLTIARNYVIDELMDEALTPVMESAIGLAAEAGVNPHYVQIGLVAMQATGTVKAAKGRGLRGGACFVAGTGVVTAQNNDGTLITRAIEDIKVGDLVLARDQYDAADDLDLRRVSQVFVRQSNHLRTLVIAGDEGNIETLQTTDEHPFYVQGRGWVGAGQLRQGDLVQEADGTWQTVLRSLREDHATGITVYNFEVEGDHTYFVDDGVGDVDAVWVHNTYNSHVTPSGTVGGTPSGPKAKIPANLRPSQKLQLVRQNESADLLASKGYVVVRDPPTLPNGKNPDYKIEGEYYDCYAPTSSNPNSICSNMNDQKIRRGQADRIVMNLEDTPVTPQQIQNVLEQYPIPALQDVIFIKNGQIIH